ncbi:D-lactaldehyde dehydrogenase [Gloeopeniophorella convolvens]|nr:D-lactaldehyde dehydrogenase [Gloeopeniophorella convolvens]
MPAVSAPAKALVTGANGYIAVWVVRALLDAGYAVRGTVRSAAKGAHLIELFASTGAFEVAVVEDITQDGAFDEAVRGIELVAHTASPFRFDVAHPDELVVPAVKGTVSILESVRKFGTEVKRVVVTSSTAAVLRPATGPAPVTFDESSWNEPAVQELAEKGAAVSAVIAYRASKTLAEKAAWEFYERNKGSVPWDLVVLNPPFVFGPPIHAVRSLRELNTSMQSLYDTVVRGARGDAALAESAEWVDVRDLALAHRLAGERPAAGGERIIVTAGPFFWQELVDVANAVAPAPLAGLARGKPELIQGRPYVTRYASAKMARVLGLEPRGLAEMMRDTLEAFARFEESG